MSHHHDCSKHHSSGNIKVAFVLNVVFTVIEFVGGWMTNSVAIMSDAVHDLGDSFSLGLAWYLENIATKKRTKQFSYGYKRFSLLGAMINILILFVGSIYILFEAIPRFISPEQTNTQGMFLLSLLGIIVNGFAVWKTMHGKKLNEQVVSLHLREDVLGRGAVLMVSVVMMFTDALWLDPLLSLGITIVILKGVFQKGKEVLRLFLQATPQVVDTAFLEKILLQQTGIKNIHDIHLWSLDGETHIFTAHIVIGKKHNNKQQEQIKQGARTLLQKHGIEHATLEIEREGEQCGVNCDEMRDEKSVSK